MKQKVRKACSFFILAKTFFLHMPRSTTLTKVLWTSTTSLQATRMKGSVYVATSVDGFIATKDGDVSFLEEKNPPLEEEGDMGFAEFLASIDVIIMGRNSFDKVISFGKETWPYGNTKMVVWSLESRRCVDTRLSERYCV